MAIPVLKLNLVPSPTLWRQRHEFIGWVGLVVGLLSLGGSLGAWGVQAARTQKAVRESVQFSQKSKKAAQAEAAVRQQLASMDLAKEMPRWRLAERIYLERGLPWSRATAELERSLADGVRIKALSRTRGTEGKVELKLRGESRTREAEVAFVERLQKNPFFAQVVLERETERQGGGLEFELRLPMVPTPPPYEPLPEPEVKIVEGPVPPGYMKAPAPKPARGMKASASPRTERK